MKRALIVDDSALKRRSIKNLLETSGFEVVGEADNGLSAVQLYNELKPDMVTMDITVPKLDGIKVIKMIKEIDNSARIIIITSLGHEHQVKDAISLGAVGFIMENFPE
ncbi:chemotaxis protein CheY [Desulfosporosinus acididurans]|uniref:Stage 0 sporulation protein A homolog n=1 Tax=Desulfosporosinus acididurans TaxID=476652 RepID=A0A0J1FKL9_9FIRM|nr:response regulator [Desulfosporosinus acididurans]KLU63957.1 chemotaxis protein CheY [Desulfosporosinus acididurans]